MAQTVKCLSIMRETWVRCLGQEDSLEKEIHSSTLAQKIPWMEEPDAIHGIAKSQTQLSDYPLFLSKITFTPF